MQVSPTRFRVPDLRIALLSTPKEQVLRTPPFLCIEVLSPKDTLRKMRRRVQEYFSLGVEHIWIFDFNLRNVTICGANNADSVQSEGDLIIPGTPISVPPAEIFAALDEP